MDDKQFKLFITAISELTKAVKDIGGKISSNDVTLTEAIIKISDAIELK